MCSLQYFKDFPTQPEDMKGYRFGLEDIEQTPGWSSVFMRRCPRKMLYFTRHLIANQEIYPVLIQDFIQNVMSRDTYIKYHYFPTLVELRKGIVIQKYEKIRDQSEDLFGKCLCNRQSCHNEIKWIMPFGITPEEGIELLDNLILLGADSSQFKFRKTGVDQIDLKSYDDYARSLFK